MPYTCIIVDDEPLARKLIASHLSRIENLELLQECENAIEAINFLHKKPVDLIFLDIQMPEVSGFDFIKTLKHSPSIILTTAHRHFAPEAFDLDVVDYILKPVSFDRLLKGINKFMDKHKSILPAAPNTIEPETFIHLKSDRKIYKVLLPEIVYIESLDDYVKVHLTDKVIISRENISTLESRLPPTQFVRIHRSFLVAINKIASFSAEGIELNGKQFPLGRAYKQRALATLGIKPA